MKIIFLGTGAGIPSKERNVTSLIVDLSQEINELWMFDCGEATQQQLLRTTIKPRKISKIFITHLHGDHIFGLPGFLSSRSFLGAENDPIMIYGPKGIKDFVEMSLSLSKTHVTYPISFVELEENGRLFDEERFSVDCVQLDHNVQSFGYKITEKDQIGELNVEKLKKLGIEPGPIYRKIKENERTALRDDRVIERKDVVGPPKKGKVITIFGDTKYVPEHIDFCRGADVLVHEATFSNKHSDLARNYSHSTTVQAATFAKEADVQALILTHISSRYQKQDTKTLLQEARNIFIRSYIAHDFASYDVKKETFLPRGTVSE